MARPTLMVSAVILVTLSGYGLHLYVLDRYEIDDLVVGSWNERHDETQDYAENIRDIFSSNKKNVAESQARKALAVPVKKEEQKVSLENGEEDRREVGEKVPVAKYLGHIIKSGKVKAFIEFNGERVVVGAGDFISPQFRVTEITEDAVKLQQEPTDIIHVLHLGGG